MSEKKESRFETVEKSKFLDDVNSRIIKDKVTGVHYLFVLDGYGGGLTPLLDDNGKPIIAK